jgi:hypothetical protein
MRTLFVAVVAVPFALSAQDTPSPAVQAWQKSNAASLATYEADRAKVRPKVEKALVDLERREENWLALGRDFFGMTQNTNMDPQRFERRRLERREALAVDDSSAIAVIEARKSGNPATAVAALKRRAVALARIIPENDSSYVDARRYMNWSSRQVDRYKAEENPSLPADQKQLIKRIIDWYDKLGRASRERAEYHEERGKAWKTERNAINRLVAEAEAALR